MQHAWKHVERPGGTHKALDGKRRHRIQPVEGPVLDPVGKETCFQRGQNVDSLKSKVVPLEGPVLVLFWHLHCRKLLKCLFEVEADLISSSCGWNLELGRSIFVRPLFLTV